MRDCQELFAKKPEKLAKIRKSPIFILFFNMFSPAILMAGFI
jgi:hypothetical protein